MSPERDLVHDSRVFGRQERLLCEHLEQANHVALTADVWTDWRSHAFLALTVHTLISGEPKSQLLASRHFPGTQVLILQRRLMPY